MKLKADRDLDEIMALMRRHGAERLPFLWRFDQIWLAVEIDALRRAGHGPPSFDVRLRAHPTELPSGLTPAELDVLTQLIVRDTDAEIATALRVSVRTVHTHVARVRRKLGLGRPQAAARALVRGWYCPQGPGASAMEAILALRN
ncbi:helix-turn-helix transcriptional regulator [Agromyces sp. H66]|uniref:helix-turn-helix domain-containing protein n=1 Tax=Agromyces sp. H66 TaxID=2529859 RepID=UPI0010AA877C|nr:helix-turn-helix transcriptional regulator [Agromyces sp. H66]